MWSLISHSTFKVSTPNRSSHIAEILQCHPSTTKTTNILRENYRESPRRNVKESEDERELEGIQKRYGKTWEIWSLTESQVRFCELGLTYWFCFDYVCAFKTYVYFSWRYREKPNLYISFLDKVKLNICFSYREKYHSVEEETAEGSKKAKQQLEFLKKRVSETVEEAQKAEILQKACKWLWNRGLLCIVFSFFCIEEKLMDRYCKCIRIKILLL